MDGMGWVGKMKHTESGFWAGNRVIQYGSNGSYAFNCKRVNWDTGWDTMVRGFSTKDHIESGIGGCTNSMYRLFWDVQAFSCIPAGIAHLGDLDVYRLATGNLMWRCFWGGPDDVKNCSTWMYGTWGFWWLFGCFHGHGLKAYQMEYYWIKGNWEVDFHLGQTESYGWSKDSYYSGFTEGCWVLCGSGMICYMCWHMGGCRVVFSCSQTDDNAKGALGWKDCAYWYARGSYAGNRGGHTNWVGGDSRTHCVQGLIGGTRTCAGVDFCIHGPSCVPSRAWKDRCCARDLIPILKVQFSWGKTDGQAFSKGILL
ncbi:hypothetical protein E3N88_11107 [Mikania micrantha]|uniref:Uncharacterized protein n=1 Tax=Mikania micrantha TaxID=192012 RepID=A0A5N6PFE2_9ASTR|nr:hypothetical protein E3N88_11107 [Mikania micrantha]